jgi:hypothetical protein
MGDSLRSQLERLRSVDGVTETDLELILLDLLHRSPGFAEFLVARALDGQQIRDFVGAWRSLDEHTGAGHLTMIATAAARDVALLIEGRVSAPSLPRQAARQRERGALGTGDGSWAGFATCLVAPRDYLECERVPGWDCLVAIEDILAFAETDPPGILAAVLAAAIVQYRDHRSTPDDPAVVAFFDAYARLCEREYPDLRLHRPSLGRTDDPENWAQFADGFIQREPTDVRLCHRTGLGQVDVEIARAKPAEVRLFLEAAVPPGAAIERAGEATVIRFQVSVLDYKRPFAEQESIVRAALDRARELLSFWMQYRARLGYGDAPY